MRDEVMLFLCSKEEKKRIEEQAEKEKLSNSNFLLKQILKSIQKKK